MMENIWGRLKEPQKLTLYTGSPSDEVQNDLTKATIRKKVWEFMERNDIANFPRPVYHRIPNFKGASAAGDKVTTLSEFQEAKHVKVNPDKPQEEVRFRTLEAGKTLFVPTPRLTQGLFNRLEPEPGCTKESLRKMSSRYGIDSLSKPVPMASRIKIDLVVIGSVAVDRLGHRIGKGEGFADLEWSMAASHHSAVTPETVVISTVHDVQVFDELPESLFSSHDLPVDIIVTPTEVIRISKKLPKPDHIEWNKITREMYQKIDVLKHIQLGEKIDGKNVKLADGYEEFAPLHKHNKPPAKLNNERASKSSVNTPLYGKAKKPRKIKNLGESPRGKAKQICEQQGNISKTLNKEKHNDGHNHVKNDMNVPKQRKEVAERLSIPHDRVEKNSPENKKLIGICISRIPKASRATDLKEEINKRGLSTKKLLWRGTRGCAFLHLSEDDTNLTADEVCDLLKDMRLKERSLNIHPKNQKEKPTAGAQTSDIQTKEFCEEKEQNKVDVCFSQTESKVVQLGEQICLPERQHKKSPCSESNDQVKGGNQEILNQIKSNKKSSKNESTSSSPSRIIIPSIIQKLVDHSVHRSKKKKIIETVETTPPKSNLITNSEVASHETMSIEHETVNNQERSKDTNHKISVNSTVITETEENMKTLESKSSGAKNIISGFLKALWK